jgi:hypothetical protein
MKVWHVIRRAQKMSAHTNKSGDPIPLLQKKTKKWVTYTT